MADRAGAGTAGVPEAAGSGVAVPGCELCAARPLTPWFHADDTCWVAECLICRTPDHFHAHARDPAWPGFAWGG